MARHLMLAAAAAALAACTAAPSGAPGAAKSGGASGRMGPGYCQSVPSDPGERNRWNKLCFGST